MKVPAFSVFALIVSVFATVVLGSTELKYGEMLFKCRLDKPRCPSRSVCGIEVYGYPKDEGYKDLFVTLYQGQERNIKDPEFIYDTKIALPAKYEANNGRYVIHVNPAEFPPMRFFLEIKVDAEKPEAPVMGFFREKPEDEPVLYYCRQLKAGLNHK